MKKNYVSSLVLRQLLLGLSLVCNCILAYSLTYDQDGIKFKYNTYNSSKYGHYAEIWDIEISKSGEVDMPQHAGGCQILKARTTLVAPDVTKLDFGLIKVSELTLNCPNLEEFTSTGDSFCDYDGGPLPKLKQLNLPNAISVTFFNIASDVNIDVPKATSISISGEGFRTLRAPSATELSIKGCQNLSELSCDKALSLTIADNVALSNLNLPVATYISINNLSGLTAINVPEVVTCGYVKNCPKLKELSLPKLESFQSSTNNFENNTALISVNLPSLKSTTRYLFNNCVSLKNVNLSALESIGVGTFCNCKSLIDFSSLLIETLPEKAFEGCESLTKVVFPSVTYVGKSCFNGCIGLQTVDIPFLETIDELAFNNAKALQEIKLPSLVKINGGAFNNSGLLVFETENNIAFGQYVFCGCENLKRISIPNTTIANTYPIADNCPNLEFIELGCTKADRGVATNVPRLREVLLDKITSYHPYVGDNAFFKGLNLDYLSMAEVTSLPSRFVSTGIIRRLNIPKVTIIFSPGLENCTELCEVYAPSVAILKDNAFNGCKKLTTLTLGDIETIPYKAFASCESLQEPFLPASVKSIGDYAFSNCKGMKWICIPEGITTIGKGAFEGCSSVKEIVLNRSLKEIPEYAFSNCGKVDRLVIPSSVEKIGGSAFRLTEIEHFKLEEGENIYNVSWFGRNSESKVRTLEMYRPVSSDYYDEQTPSVKSIVADGLLAEPRENKYPSLEYIELGENVHFLPKNLFVSQNVNIIKVDALVPPGRDDDRATTHPFEFFNPDVYENASLIVPEAAAEAYSVAEPWQRFKQSTLLNKYFYNDRSHSPDAFNLDDPIPVEGLTADGVTQIALCSDVLNFGDEYTYELQAPCESSTDNELDLGKIETKEIQDGRKILVYTAPADYPFQNEHTTIICKLTIKGTGKRATTSIQLYRPALFLVHGLNSSNDCWKEFYGHLITKGMYSDVSLENVNYEYANTLTFHVNKKNLCDRLNRRSHQLNKKRIAHSKFDFIGHSMGGIISRLVQHEHPQDVNKIITVNTPHSGSQGADLVKWLYTNDGVYSFLESKQRWPGDLKWLRTSFKAVEDLATDSKEILSLNSDENLRIERQAKVHAITSTMLYTGDAYDDVDWDAFFNKYLDNFLDVAGISIQLFRGKALVRILAATAVGVIGFGAFAVVNDESFLTYIFDSPSHDGVVSMDSQRGGLPDERVTIFASEPKGLLGLKSDTHHMNIYKGTTNVSEGESAVWTRLKFLLNTPKSSEYFADGFKPEKLTNKFARQPFKTGLLTQTGQDLGQNTSEILVDINIEAVCEKTDGGDLVKFKLICDKPLTHCVVWVSDEVSNECRAIVCDGEGEILMPQCVGDHMIGIEAFAVDADRGIHFANPKGLRIESGNMLYDIAFDADCYFVKVNEEISPEVYSIVDGDKQYAIPADLEVENNDVAFYDGKNIIGLKEGESRIWADYDSKRDFAYIYVLQETSLSNQDVKFTMSDKFDIKFQEDAFTVRSKSDFDENTMIKFYDINGMCIYSENFVLRAGEYKSIDLSALRHGMIVGSIQVGKDSRTVKILNQ